MKSISGKIKPIRISSLSSRSIWCSFPFIVLLTLTLFFMNILYLLFIFSILNSFTANTFIQLQIRFIIIFLSWNDLWIRYIDCHLLEFVLLLQFLHLQATETVNRRHQFQYFSLCSLLHLQCFSLLIYNEEMPISCIIMATVFDNSGSWLKSFFWNLSEFPKISDPKKITYFWLFQFFNSVAFVIIVSLALPLKSW